MNIQIYGKSKCFDTKKAQRWFQERRIRFQLVDLPRKGLSPRELQSVKAAVGGLDALIDPKAPEAATLRYLALDSQKAGMRSGPLHTADLVGHDVNLAIMETLYNETGDTKYRPHPLLRKMVRAGWLGIKTGRGFFTYDEKGKEIPGGELTVK